VAVPYYIKGVTTGVDELRWNRDEPLGSPVNVTYSFFTQVPDYANKNLHPLSGDARPSSFHEFTDAQRHAVHDILAQYAGIANLIFEDTGDDAAAQMHFGGNYQKDSLAYAYFPYEGYEPAGDVWLAQWASMARVAPGEAGYATLIHEIGHALGLKHPFDTEAGGWRVTLGGVENTEQYTVMAYSLHPHAEFYDTGGHLREIEASTPMLYDIAAIQYLYGANLATRAGDDVYSFRPDEPFLMCIWDGAGNDTISVARFALGCDVDLRAGHFSDIAIRSAPGFGGTYDGTDNLSIAFGVVIENAIGGQGADRLRGNDAANALRGGGGADTLVGGVGNDWLEGGYGRDVLVGGAGADTFYFRVSSGAAADVISAFTPGVDTIVLDEMPGLIATAAARVTYDADSGRLYYDADGAGSGEAKLVAKVLGGDGHPAALRVADDVQLVS
jgi:serralysin